MKTKLFALALAFILAIPVATFASNDTKTAGAQKREELRKESNKKIAKDAAKEAKKMSKEGWKTKPGSLSLEKQLEKTYLIDINTEADGITPLYFKGTGTSTGQSYEAAKQQALQNARLDIAAQIGSEVTNKMSGAVANNEISTTLAESVNQFLSENQAVVSQRLANMIPLVECYQELPNGNVTVRIVTAMSKESALLAAKNVLRVQLGEDSEFVNKALGK